jgi:hypothetical protein
MIAVHKTKAHTSKYKAEDDQRVSKTLRAVPVLQQKPTAISEKHPGTALQKKELESKFPLQAKFEIPFSAQTHQKAIQRFALPPGYKPETITAPIQKFVLPNQTTHEKANNTGLPDSLKSGVENLSGFSMDDVKVHYNSSQPAQLQAHAYAQGTDIHIAPGQEEHLPHEAWHVVQQKQGKVKATMQMKGGVDINDDQDLEKEASVMGGMSISAKIPSAIQLKSDALHQEKIVQRILHKGSTTRSEEYVRATKLGKHDKDIIQEYIDSDKHYKYDKKKDEFVEITEKKKEKKDNKRKRSSSGTDGEFTGWMGKVDQGVEGYNEKGDIEIEYKARQIKDEGKGGYNVGINNIANIKGLKKTGRVKMNENQVKLNFFANHLVKNITEEGYTTDNKEDYARKKKKLKTELGPEVQQIISTKDGELNAHFGGNYQKSQELIRRVLVSKKNKKRKLKDYHREEYRDKTINETIRQIEKILRKNPKIEKQLKQLIAEKKSNDEIRSMLKSAIGDDYKNDMLRYLFKLRNSLKAKYGDLKLEDAIINVPDNLEEIHAESNLLEKIIDEFEILDVMGTKVPCVACFAKFCQAKQQTHLLQYTSSVWFSKPCMNQLGCDFSEQSTEEVISYLNKIDQNLKGMVNRIEMYTGNMGNIKQEFNDDDSDSMGEESRQEIIDKYSL